MAKKTTTKSTSQAPASKTPAPEVTVTPVRNSAVPPKTAAAVPVKKAPATRDDIALRAYFIWKSSGGSQFDNWIRAERELGI